MLARRAVLASATAAVAASSFTARASMAPLVPLPSTASLADAPLKPLGLAAGGGAVVKASSLWRDKPAVIVAVRRPGCQLCRAEVKDLLARVKPQLEGADVRLVAILHEEVTAEVAEFKSDFWPGELYLDETKAVYAALGGGAVRRGSLLSFLNPWSRIWCALATSARAARRLDAARAHRTHVKASNRVVEKSNLVGDGLTFGGLLVIRRDGGVQYAFQEQTFGDHAPPEDVLDAALKASAAR